MQVTTELRQTILDRWNKGATTFLLARKYKTSRREIFRILALAGAAKRPKPKMIPKSEHPIVVESYLRGTPPLVLAAKYEVGWRQIKTILRHANVTTRNRSEAARRFPLNESAFDDISNESAAYWCGFIAADGCIVKNRNVVFIGLAQGDIDHLYKFRDFLECKYPVRTRFGKSKRMGNYWRCEIAITSRIICDRLTTLGIRSNKPQRTLPPQLIVNPHFWRGMIDGDGWFGLYENIQNGKIRKRIALGFAGSHQVVAAFNCFIKDRFPQIKVSVRNAGNFYKIHISNRWTVEIIALLYGSANIALDRKMDNAKAILSLHSVD